MDINWSNGIYAEANMEILIKWNHQQKQGIYWSNEINIETKHGYLLIRWTFKKMSKIPLTRASRTTPFSLFFSTSSYPSLSKPLYFLSGGMGGLSLATRRGKKQNGEEPTYGGRESFPILTTQKSWRSMFGA